MSSNRSVTLRSRGGIVETGDGTRFLVQSNMAGPGGLTKAGDGLLVLTGSQIRGRATIEAGVLQIGHCGTTGSIVGNVVNDGLLVFSRSDTSTYAGSITGAGGVMKNCTGTLTLRGTNTYSAGTLINAGTLVGDTGSLQGAILNNSALFFDQDDDGTFRGTISGSGTLDKTEAVLCS